MARNRRRGDKAEKEWEAYACQIPRSDGSGFDPRFGFPLTEVYHVARVSDACRIIEDREIKAGLIGDESRLRKSRTSVCWFSANSWPSLGAFLGDGTVGRSNLRCWTTEQGSVLAGWLYELDAIAVSVLFAQVDRWEHRRDLWHPKSHTSSKRMQIADFRYKRRDSKNDDSEAALEPVQG